MYLSSIKKKEKVSDQVLAQLKDALFRGELKPGDKIPGVVELSEKLGVGISSVREAIKMLESLGAVESRQGEGTFVCTSLKEGVANAFEIQLALLPQTVEYLVEFRAIYETVYTHLAMDHAASEDLSTIEEIVRALEEKVKHSPVDALVESADELSFHRAVLYSTHNPYIIKIGEVALDLFYNVLQEKTDSLAMTSAASGHRKIYSAICNKDDSALKEILKESFDWWEKRFRNKDQQNGGNDAAGITD